MSVPEPPKLVLDTNVVLDWLVFADPAVAGLADAIVNRRLCWLTSPAMRAELSHMLGHASLARWEPDSEQALAFYDRFSHRVDDPAPAGRAPARCRDPDDQVFLDVAWQGQARWLVTRDKALLALDRRVRDAGLCIVTPTRLAWNDGGPPQQARLTEHANDPAAPLAG